MERIQLLFCLTVLFVSACSKEDYIDFQIAISTEKCMTYTPMPDEREVKGLMVKGIDGLWGCSVLPYMIDGFEYKEGYDYELLIRRTNVKVDKSIMDHPGCVYTLIKVISMTPVNNNSL